MGTNYYWHKSGNRECPCCERETPSLHIGKLSYGWAFSLRIHPYDGIVNLEDWKERWASGGAIFDEYGSRQTVEYVLNAILNPYPPPAEKLRHHRAPDVPQSNDAYGGPTYDLCDHEFS